MNKLNSIFIIILTFIAEIAIAHQDFWVIKDYGNIKVRVKTGFQYEEINKAFIIGQLSQKLSKELNYKEPIFLDFNHAYTGDCDPDYFISYDKGNILQTWTNEKQKDFLKENSIIVRQVSRKFDFVSTLKILEYAILNLTTIKSAQRQITYNQNYCQWKINTIDTILIKNHLKTYGSEILTKILKNKIDRHDKNFKYGVSYYWEDNKFNIYRRDYNGRDTILLTVDNIYDYHIINGNSTVIFNSDSTFYHIGRYKKPMTSKKHLIENTFDYYQPFDLKDIGGDKITIYFWSYTKDEGRQPRDRTLIYLIDKDRLIQDLDKLIDKKE